MPCPLLMKPKPSTLPSAICWLAQVTQQYDHGAHLFNPDSSHANVLRAQTAQFAGWQREAAIVSVATPRTHLFPFGASEGISSSLATEPPLLGWQHQGRQQPHAGQLL